MNTQLSTQTIRIVTNRVSKLLVTTDASQLNHVSGPNNPVDIGTRTNTVDELKRSDWLTGPTWLRPPDYDWPEQVKLTFASDEEKGQTASISKTEKKKINSVGTVRQFQQAAEYN